MWKLVSGLVALFVLAPAAFVGWAANQVGVKHYGDPPTSVAVAQSSTAPAPSTLTVPVAQKMPVSPAYSVKIRKGLEPGETAVGVLDGKGKLISVAAVETMRDGDQVDELVIAKDASGNVTRTVHKVPVTTLGAQRLVCPTCDGTGEVTCPTCHGRKTSQDQDCRNCGIGAGKVYWEKSGADDHVGHHFRGSDFGRRKGKKLYEESWQGIPCVVYDCPDCKDGYPYCKTCKGTGHAGVCPTCQGTKYILAADAPRPAS